MGRVRNLCDMALAVGAIAGILAVLSPQTLWNGEKVQSVTSAQAVSSKARAVSSKTESLPLSQFVGIAQFVKSPTEYSINIDGQIAEVTAASLRGKQMTISYAHNAKSKHSTGKLVGTVDSDGAFSGKRQKAATKSSAEEAVTFTFEADGTSKMSEGENSSAVKLMR